MGATTWMGRGYHKQKSTHLHQCASSCKSGKIGDGCVKADNSREKRLRLDPWPLTNNVHHKVSSVLVLDRILNTVPVSFWHLVLYSAQNDWNAVASSVISCQLYRQGHDSSNRQVCHSLQVKSIHLWAGCNVIDKPFMRTIRPIWSIFFYVMIRAFVVVFSKRYFQFLTSYHAYQ